MKINFKSIPVCFFNYDSFEMVRNRVHPSKTRRTDFSHAIILIHQRFYFPFFPLNTQQNKRWVMLAVTWPAGFCWVTEMITEGRWLSGVDTEHIVHALAAVLWSRFEWDCDSRRPAASATGGGLRYRWRWQWARLKQSDVTDLHGAFTFLLCFSSIERQEAQKLGGGEQQRSLLKTRVSVRFQWSL